MRQAWPLVENLCAGCEDFPCRCRVRIGNRRREECVCGLVIVAASSSSDDIREAVARHNIEPVHEQWRNAVLYT